MFSLQILVNGLLLGGLYACIGAGFSLVWGVLNIINVLHGAFIVLGAYLAYFAYGNYGIHPYLFVPVAGGLLFALGYAVQWFVINRVAERPVLVTITLTFGLTLLLDNIMLLAFHADFRKISLQPPLGVLDLAPLDVFVPVDSLASMGFAIVLGGLGSVPGLLIVALIVFLPGGLFSATARWRPAR